MAKSVSVDEAVLAGLRKAMEVLPALLPLTGTKGIYPQKNPKGQELADIAIAQGFLKKTEKITTGKKPKTVVYGHITEKGIRRVLESDSPKAALEALLPAVQALDKEPNPEAFQAALARATETCVNEIRAAFASLHDEVVKALAPSSAPTVDPGIVLNALRQTLERVEAPVLPAVAATPPGVDPAPSLPAPPVPALEEAIIEFVDRWAKEKTVGCQFDALWDHLKEQYPHLTIGMFQDAIRKLYDAGRIRLGGWARMHDDLPHPELALFVSSKVMYYAQPAHPTG